MKPCIAAEPRQYVQCHSLIMNDHDIIHLCKDNMAYMKDIKVTPSRIYEVDGQD